MTFRGTRAGKYRQVVELQQRGPQTQDRAGSVVANWLPYITDFRVDINPGRGREYESAKQKHAELTHIVSARWIPHSDLTELRMLRIAYTPPQPPPAIGESPIVRIFEIINVVNKDETNRELLFLL